MNAFCFLFIYFFEQFISYTYFSNKFECKKNLKFIFLLFSISFVLQYILNQSNIPYLNLVSFFVCNYIILTLCFNATIKQALFNVIILEGFMITTELLVMYSISILFNIQLNDFSNNATVIFLETAASKTLYFLLAYVTSKISIKQNTKNIHDFSYILFVLPLVSIFVIISFVYLSIQLSISQTIYYLFTTISLSLLLSNIIIFLVHEKIKKTLITNTELQLAAQKSEINKEHYKELERQYDLSNLLIHDIKKHLDIIKNLAIQSNDADNIVKYVDSVYDCNEVKTLRQFSKNKIVNVIISRYAHLCNLEKIDLLVDIRNINFSFINESDLTALLDNLLSNAFEAAKESTTKFISIVVDKKNEHYIIFNVVNSCDTTPEKAGDFYATAKVDKSRHGYGLKIIDKIAKKYCGNSLFKHDSDNNEFLSSIVLKYNE